MPKYCCGGLEIPPPEHTRAFKRTGTPFVLSHNRIFICCPNVSLGTAFIHKQFFLTSNRSYPAITALCALPTAPLTQPLLLVQVSGGLCPSQTLSNIFQPQKEIARASDTLFHTNHTLWVPQNKMAKENICGSFFYFWLINSLNTLYLQVIHVV